ncbi:unnamed protein product [Larinioides sclopetarius]|uniref:Complex III subunit 9 n=1 Tax=Larinioides sclopetarius TaxID=280406 RepID=A0AAV2B2V5_9ARAC
MAGFVSTLYHGLFKRTSTFALTIIVGAFFFERAVDVGCDYVYDKYNEGKQWKDIKHKYVQE